MAHPSERAGTSSGDFLARTTEREVSQKLRLDDARVQVYLARLAFPGDAAAMDKWLEEKGVEDSLSRRYRAFIEDRTCVPEDAVIDIKDKSALEELFAGVRAHEPERTVH